MASIFRNGFVIASVFGAFVAAPVRAVVPVTYVFDLAGSGLTTAFDPVTSANTQTPLGGAQIIFAIQDATAGSFFQIPTSPGSSFFAATPAGLSWTFSTSFLGLSGNGNVCFSNPTGAFPIGPVALTGGAGCGAATYTEQGKTILTTFSGVVTRMSILAGTPGQAASITVSSLPAVPEPATWGAMLAGFAAVGLATRRARRRDRLALPR